MSDYDPATYWESRYKHFDITSSGHKDLPIQYNAWLYRMKKKKIHRLARQHCDDFSTAEFIELGCGTGVYVEMWKELGVRSLKGLDIAPNAISQLKERHPEYSFHSEDLSDETLSQRYGKDRYDVVTVIGVLVHIINDEQFRSAVNNIAELMKKDGSVLVSDYLVRGEADENPAHMNFRSLDGFVQAFNEAGLEMVRQVPLYFFMINPFDTPSFIGRFFLPRFYSLTSRMIYRFPGFTGYVLYHIDSLITRILRHGPSEKLFVFRKVAGNSAD